MKKSINFLEQLNIDKNKKLVVATSGGPDSMALLYALKSKGYNLICAHVNHNLREVSDSEYVFVKNYCEQNNIIFEGMKIETYFNNRFTEDEARKKRYAFYEIFAAGNGGDRPLCSAQRYAVCPISGWFGGADFNAFEFMPYYARKGSAPGNYCIGFTTSGRADVGNSSWK